MAKSKRLPKWGSTLVKLTITVLGFYFLLTHEVSTWVKGDAGVWAVPVTVQVVDVQLNDLPLAPSTPQALAQDGAVGWYVDNDLLRIKLADGANPSRAAIEVAGEPKLGRLAIARAIGEYVQKVDAKTFIVWSVVAMAVKFVGVIASAMAWSLLLRGQGLRFPFWHQVMTAFLIGRFVGTFLPSTIGLDAYTLFEAGRYSNQWPRVITAKALEKFIGVAGLFAGLLLTLPAGYLVLAPVLGDAAPLVVVLIGGISLAITGGVSVGLVFPQIPRMVLLTVRGFIPGRIGSLVESFITAATAYQGQPGLIISALLLKFVTHFTTALVYFFTALAIGVVGVSFLPIVFGSLIQILGTLLSPTIAGEGAREAIQALLLSHHLGGAAQAVLSAALGFVAAEAATMWGGAFLWTRTASWRPRFVTVDGEQVDYSWLSDDDDGRFDADAMAQARQQGAPQP